MCLLYKVQGGVVYTVFFVYTIVVETVVARCFFMYVSTLAVYISEHR